MSDMSDWPHYTPLQAAVNELEDGGTLEALRLLIDNGADVNGWDIKHAATPLLIAVFRGQRDAVQLLLKAGADPNVMDDEGDSPLRWAVDHDDLETAALLLRHGATKTIDEVGGENGYTALGLAAKRLNAAMIKLLLDSGANPTARDEDGKTALERLPPLGQSDKGQREAAVALLRL